jgi:hypothetical protein
LPLFALLRALFPRVSVGLMMLQKFFTVLSEEENFSILLADFPKSDLGLKSEKFSKV